MNKYNKMTISEWIDFGNKVKDFYNFSCDFWVSELPKSMKLPILTANRSIIKFKSDCENLMFKQLKPGLNTELSNLMLDIFYGEKINDNKKNEIINLFNQLKKGSEMLIKNETKEINYNSEKIFNISEKDILKLWEKTYHGDLSSYKVFKNWIIKYNIKTKVKNYDYVCQLKGQTKKRYENIRFSELNQIKCSIDNHSIYTKPSCWKNQDKQKIFIIQPYLSHNEEIDKSKLDRIDKWCNVNELYYKILDSWYYPKECMMVQISNRLL